MAKKASRGGARHAAELRRARVAQLLKAGLKQREIAAQVGCALGTVNRDIQILRERWWESQLADIELALLTDLERLDDALRAITNEVRSGDLQAIDRLLRLVELRSTLLGYKWLHQAEIDWRIEAVRLIREGGLDYQTLEQEVGDGLAEALFEQAGVPVLEPGDADAPPAGGQPQPD